MDRQKRRGEEERKREGENERRRGGEEEECTCKQKHVQPPVHSHTHTRKVSTEAV